METEHSENWANNDVVTMGYDGEMTTAPGDPEWLALLQSSLNENTKVSDDPFNFPSVHRSSYELPSAVCGDDNASANAVYQLQHHGMSSMTSFAERAETSSGWPTITERIAHPGNVEYELPATEINTSFPGERNTISSYGSNLRYEDDSSLHEMLGQQLPFDLALYDCPSFAPTSHHPYPLADGWNGMIEPFKADVEDNDDDEEGYLDASDPCYAKLLYRCLKEAPDNTMSLKDLYEWVARHSQKAKDPASRGWQNSVRHNLSMNAAFERVHMYAHQGPKKGSLWRLTAQALREGVISTTRYRKDPKRKPDRRSIPAPKRQISGQKGGQATRRAAQIARNEMLRAHGLPTSGNGNDMIRRINRNRGRYGNNGYFNPPSSMPSSRLTSPHPGMLPVTAPTSPYFASIKGDCSALPFVLQQSSPGPHTPPPVQLPFNGGPACSGEMQSYNFQYINPMNGGIFGDHDDVPPETPSLASEASVGTDEGAHGLFSPHASREATIC